MLRNYIVIILMNLCACSAFACSTESDLLKTIEHEPEIKASSSIILLHGAGGNNKSFIDLINQAQLMQEVKKLQEATGARIILPQAPLTFPQKSGNYWFNLPTMDVSKYVSGEIEEDETGIKKSQKAINKLIDQEIKRGIPSEKIILVGHSQGGAMALYSGLHCDKKLGGILVLSAWLPLHTLRKDLSNSSANIQTPILMLHGTTDNTVPLWAAEKSHNYLNQLGFNVKLSTYESMDHGFCAQELATMANWLFKLVTGSTNDYYPDANFMSHKGVDSPNYNSTNDSADPALNNTPNDNADPASKNTPGNNSSSGGSSSGGGSGAGVAIAAGCLGAAGLVGALLYARSK